MQLEQRRRRYRAGKREGSLRQGKRHRPWWSETPKADLLRHQHQYLHQTTLVTSKLLVVLHLNMSVTIIRSELLPTNFDGLDYSL